MANYTQASRPIAVSTPLGPDVLLITGFSGEEGMSASFHFQVDCIAEKDAEIAFDALLGQKITSPNAARRQAAFQRHSASASRRVKTTRISRPTGWMSCRNSGCSPNGLKAGFSSTSPCRIS